MTFFSILYLRSSKKHTGDIKMIKQQKVSKNTKRQKLYDMVSTSSNRAGISFAHQSVPKHFF